MSRIQWSDAFATGIHVIDQQHKRIVNYINQLDDVSQGDDRKLLREVLFNLVDYTLSHFTFEEALMEESGYPGACIHSQTHDSFRERISDYQRRLDNNEDIRDELGKLLKSWLVAHIADDDNSYVPYIRNNMAGTRNQPHDGWVKHKVQEIFH